MTEKQVNILLKVKAQILEDPHHLIMDYFSTDLNNLIRFLNKDRLKHLHCGTVGCIAGHVCGLPAYSGHTLRYMEQKAARKLGLLYEEAEALFYFPFERIITESKTHKAYLPERVALTKHKPGTKGYARVVAQAIDRCIKRNYDGVVEGIK